MLIADVGGEPSRGGRLFSLPGDAATGAVAAGDAAGAGVSVFAGEAGVAAGVLYASHAGGYVSCVFGRGVSPVGESDLPAGLRGMPGVHADSGAGRTVCGE